MTTAATTFRLILPRLPGMLCRALVAGIAWGLFTGIGLTVWNAMHCGIFCLDAAAMDTLSAVTVGIFTMGPLATFGRNA